MTVYRKDYRPYAFSVEYCHLSFEILPDCVLVSSELALRSKQAENCILDGVNLEILELQIDGRVLEAGVDYRLDDQQLELLHTAKKEAFVFCARVKIDPYNNKSLEGMYRSGNILCSQNEATGFRHITFYPDRPDVMSRFVTEIIADKREYPRLLSNGNLLEHKELDNGRHYVRWEDPFAKPCYLYAIVAGDLDVLQDHFTTCSGRRIALEIYTDKGKTAQATFAMQSLQQAMRWDEERFGREYDLDLYMIVAVDSFNFGAMENKGLNIFNSSLVFASEETASDATYENIASVIAHEYFHNWTGNRITCRDWFQLTLKEGLTVFRDELFSEQHFGREVHRIQQLSNLRNHQYPEDAGPNRHPIRPDLFMDINNFYTQTVYEKGAAVIRMMASYLGKEGFRKGMDYYFQCFDAQAVTCDDFVSSLEKGSGKNLQPFCGWYEQAGTPQLYVKSEWNERSGELRLHLRQENLKAGVVGVEEKEFPPLGFLFPLALYRKEEGLQGTFLLEDSVLVTEQQSTLSYQLNPGSKPIPSLLLDHISPIEVHYDYDNEELLLLISSDRDAFNRYEAMQKYLQKLLLDMVPSTKMDLPVKLSMKFIEILRTWLKRDTEKDALEPRYLSYLLIAPSIQTLAAQQQGPPQFQELQRIREDYCRALAQDLEVEMLTRYYALQSQVGDRVSEPSERSSIAVGKRSLRNTMLQFLCRLEKPEYHELAYQQYQSSDNMTDNYSALQALTYWPGEHSEAALQNFIQRWQDDFLVTCRWFALQAGAPGPETLEKIKQLEQHPLFQKENPNMLRSLYSVLGNNLAVFHEPSGKCYEFLATRILQIDRFNSMIAAGLAKNFVAFKLLAAPQQAAMSKALVSILDQKGISERLYEIVSKTLQ